MSASDTTMTVEGVGSVSNPYIYRPNVYYIPELTLNHDSASQLCKSGNWVFILTPSMLYRTNTLRR